MVGRAAVAIWFLAVALPAAAQSVVVGSGAREDVLAGAKVTLAAAGASIQVQAGGTLAFTGSGTTAALQAGFAGPTAGAPISVLSGGTLDLKCAKLENLSTVTVAAGGTLLRAKDVVFQDLAGLNPAGWPWLDLSSMTASDRDRLPFSLNRITFAGVAGTRTNLKTGATTPLLRMLGNPTAGGNRWGAAYENDASNLLLWHTGAVTRSVSGSGTFDTIEDALKDSGTTAPSVLTVTLGANAFIDDVLDWNTNAASSSTGPTVKNACLAPRVGTAVYDADVGTVGRGKIINCIVAKGGVDETTAQNCTFFDPGTGTLAATNLTATNCLYESGASGGTNLNATAGFFLAAATFDFHLVSPGGNAAIDEGAVLTETLDFEGHARGQAGKLGGTALWDIGADEFPDTIAPTVVNINSDTNNGIYTIGANIQVKVTFSEPVTLQGISFDVILNATGASGSLAPLSPPPAQVWTATYTVQALQNTGDLTALSLSAPGGGLRDAMGNAAVLSIPVGQNLGDFKDFVIDTAAPTVVAVSSTTPNGTYGIAAPINVTVTFSESVALVGGPLQIRVSTGTDVNLSPTASPAVWSGTYVVLSGQSSADLTGAAALSLTGTLRDAAGNDAGLFVQPGTNLGDLHNIVVDGVAPVITSVTSSSANGPYGVGKPINVTVNISEPVFLVGGALQAQLDTGALVNLSPSTSQIWTATYTVQAGHSSADLTAVTPLSLTGTLKDAAGNSAVLTIPAGQNLGDLKDVVVETVAPTLVSVTTTNPNGPYSVGNPINVTLTFSEAVILTGGNLQVTLDAGSVVVIAPFGPAAAPSGTYTVAAGQNTVDLTVVGTPTLSAGTLTDPAGNTASLTIPGGANLGDLHDIVIDSVVPTLLSITSATADGTYGIGAGVNLTLNFSEPVELTGGYLQVTLNSGAILLLPPTGSSATQSTTYVVAAGQSSADLTLTGAPILLTGATMKDTAGNPADLAIPGGQNLGDARSIAVNTTHPTITGITSVKPDGAYGVGATIDFTIHFSENVTLAGGPLLVALDSWAVIAIPPFGPANSVTALYTVEQGDASEDLTVLGPLILDPAATLRNMAGKDLLLDIAPTLNLGYSKALVVDTWSPSLTSVGSTTPSGTYYPGASINLTLTFSRPAKLENGSLLVALNTGVTVSIPPFTLAETVSGTYLVASGQSTPLLDAADPLTLGPGATLTGQTGLNAFLDIPDWRNLQHARSIRIESTAPSAPAPPGNVRTTAYYNAVDVEWDASPSLNVAGYNVYRRLAGGTWPPTPTPLNGTTLVISRKYRDQTALNGTAYVYRVTAVGN